MFDTPNLFERVMSLPMRPKSCQTVADNQLSKRHARQFLRPRLCFQPTAGPAAGAEVFTGTSLGSTNFI